MIVGSVRVTPRWARLGEVGINIFAELMGDLVEPRRDFIQKNALTASVDV